MGCSPAPASHKPVIVIGGPTASGKSALALDLAQRLDGVVINADAMQVYRELAIVTARPGPAALRAAPHRLYGVVAAAQSYSAAQWRAAAVAAITAAHAAGRRAIVVGGSGLYLRTLMQGIADVPPIPGAIRAAVRQRVATAGAAAVHAELAAVDPATAGRLSPNDSQRVARAWEVWQATGRPLSQWHAAAPVGQGSAAPPFAFRVFVLLPPRAWLRDRCDTRFLAMIEAGALAEVAALVNSQPALDPALPAMRALGVPQLRAHLAGELSLDAAIAAAQSATRAYAKRQSTWLRHQLAPRSNVEIVDEQYSSKVEQLILSKIT